MKVSLSKSTKATLLLLVAFSMILAACTSNNNPNPSNNEGAGNGGASQEFHFTLGSEPPSLDPATITDAPSSIVASGMYDGLTRLNTDGEPMAAVAKDWVISEDGLTYTFNLRDDVKWSNGDPVTAQDFVYSWQRTLAPATGAEYAYMLYYIENAEQVNSGKITDMNQLGVKALDEHTLEVKLKSPAVYFPSVVSHTSFMPVHQATVDARKDWAAEAKTIVSNGPFLLKKWEHENKLELEKNPNYYNASAISFNKVTITLINDSNSVFNMFETGDIDWIGAQAGSVPIDRTPQLIKDGKADVKTVASTYFYLFNTTKAPFNNTKIRKAFAMSVDRQMLIDNVAKANQQPAFALVPPSMAGIEGKTFREMYPDTDYFQENLEEAKKLLAEGLAESGLTTLPEVTLLYNTDDAHKAIAEAIVDMWRKNLGVEVKLMNQEWGTFLQSRKAGQFDIARSGWGADFNHPINFTYDLIHPLSGNNDGKYNSPEVQKLLDESLVTTDIKEGVEKIAAAEKIALADDMGVLPLYYYTTVTMLKDGYKDVVSNYAGHLDWVFGSKE